MIYMTPDTWKYISELITLNEWFVLGRELCDNTHLLDISEQELDNIIKHYTLNKENYNDYKYHVIVATAEALRGELSEMYKAFNANKPYFICLPATIHVDDRLEVAKEIFLVSHHNPDKYNFAFCGKDCQTIRITVKEE